MTGANTPQPNPMRMKDLDGVVPVQFEAGDNTLNIALTDSGSVFMWGRGSSDTLCEGAASTAFTEKAKAQNIKGGPFPVEIPGGSGTVPPAACP